MSTTGTVRETMRARAIDGYGGPERLRLGTLPAPEPRPRDVLVPESYVARAPGPLNPPRAGGVPIVALPGVWHAGRVR